MTVAYLVNQYPHVSHSFIRREIAALERCGQSVLRYSLRPPPASLPDPSDQAEIPRTHCVLNDGFLRLGTSTAVMIFTHPVRGMRSLAAAIRMGWRSNRGVLRHIAYFVEACHLARLLQRNNAAHLHAHFGTNSAAVAMLVRMMGGPAYSFTVHGPEEFDKPDALSLSEKIRQAAFVVGISNFGRSQLLRWCEYREWSKIHVVRCGLDFKHFSMLDAPAPSSQQLISVGRLCEQKGQLILLDAFAKVVADYPEASLVLAGDGPMRSEIESRLKSLSLKNKVRITGWISGDEVRKLLKESRALVLPSFAEGLPVVIMEALALARPVVSTFVAGIPELVQPGINGWLIPAGSVEQLANVMRELLNSPADRLIAMGLAGATVVRALHDINHEAERLHGLIESSIATSGI